MITVTKQENGVLFTFINSDMYLYGNGTISVPFNTLSIIQDESDMITFRKSASNDIFLSARYDDMGYASKEDAVNALKGILFAKSEGGGGSVDPEEVRVIVEEETSGMSADISALYANKLDNASYDPGSHVLVFYANNIVKARIDASAFIKDGMVSNVEIANDNLVITFNTDAGKDPISIPLSSIFDSSVLDDYLTISGAASTYATITALNRKQDILTAGDGIEISGNVISAESNIIELTQAEYDALTDKDPEVLYIITDAQEINMNDYYTKSEVDASIATKADASALTAVNNALTAHTADTTVHVTQAEKNAWNGKVDTTTYESGQYATAQALNALQENKLDASAYTPTDLSEYWTSAQTQSAIDGVNNVLTAVNNALTAHTADTTVHVTQTEKALWNAKADASALTAVNSAITALSGEVIDNEYVVSQAINDLDNRLTAVEAESGSSSTDTYVSGGSVSSSNGVITLTKNDGTTATVTGLNAYVGQQIEIAKTASDGFDNSYVNVSGDTMAGALYIQTANITGAAIALKDNNTDILTIERESGSNAAVITIPNGGITNGTDSAVWGNGVSRIVTITQSAYDALTTKDSYTLYIIED